VRPKLREIEWVVGTSGANRALYETLFPSFLERYGAKLDADVKGILGRVVGTIGPPFEYPDEPFSVVHIDYRLDNLLIDGTVTPPRVTAVDWQSFVLGSPLSDVAYLLGASLLPEVRRPVEREIVRAYHARLGELGVRGYDWERCWADYRRGTFAGFAVTVVASMIVQQTPRGDEMFLTMARRHARHALDLGAEEFLTPCRK
jgi:aminoglycoside phosphotransferase (APT) family kinase protein